jgi:hypothetical protein
MNMSSTTTAPHSPIMVIGDFSIRFRLRTLPTRGNLVLSHVAHLARRVAAK